MAQLISGLFHQAFGNEWLARYNDQSAFDVAAGRMVMTTDGYVVSPLFFPGGNIGSLAAHGTINDVAMSGARPLYLSTSFIIEEGFPFSDLKVIADSMGSAARSAGVHIITGDTKLLSAARRMVCSSLQPGSGLWPMGSISPPTRQEWGTVCWCLGASAIMGWRSCQNVRTSLFKPRSARIPQRCITSWRSWLPPAVAASG